MHIFITAETANNKGDTSTGLKYFVLRTQFIQDPKS
jgi:hypothetical protein